MNLNGRLTSGKLATHANVSPDTIRHYERLGILPAAARTESGYRIFPAEATARVLAVQRALRVGYTLAELAQLFRVRDSGGVPCKKAYGLAQEKLDRVRADIAGLKETEKYLSKMLVDWKRKIRTAGPGQRAFLLSSLEDRPGAQKNNLIRRKAK